MPRDISDIAMSANRYYTRAPESITTQVPPARGLRCRRARACAPLPRFLGHARRVRRESGARRCMITSDARTRMFAISYRRIIAASSFRADACMRCRQNYAGSRRESAYYRL